MKATRTTFVLLCIVHVLTIGLSLALAYSGHWMGATAGVAVSLLLLSSMVRTKRALRVRS